MADQWMADIMTRNFHLKEKRLKKLVEILENLPDDGPEPILDMHEWVYSTTCGTVACAGGWACLEESFNEEGLKFSQFDFAPVIETEGITNIKLTGYDALQYFFGLYQFEVDLIFNPTGYTLGESTDPLAVIERINKILNRI